MRHSWWRFLVMLAALGLLVAACGGDDDDDTTGTDDGETAEPDNGDDGDADEDGDDGERAVDTEATLRVSSVTAATQWDPHRGVSSVVDYSFHSAVYDNLLELTPELEIGPMLATEWGWSDDGTVLTLQLREDATFADGEPFNADAVVANIERAQGLEGALTQRQLAPVTNVEATDEFTVDITLEEPDPSFLEVLAFHQAGRMASPAALENPDSLATSPVGVGQYNFVEMTEDRVIYERNDDYWDQELIAQTPARLENIWVPDDAARYAALETGEHDLTMAFTWRPELDQMLDGENINHTVMPSATTVRTHAVMVNLSDETFADPRVRRAISMALDRDAIRSLMGEQQCVPTASPFADDTYPDLNEQINAEYAYDPEAARELLDEAGVGEEIEVDLIAITVVSLLNDFAVAVQGQLSEVGINANITGVPPAEMLVTWREGEHPINAISIQAFANPHSLFTDWYYSLNAVGEAPQDFVELEQQANLEEFGSQEREDAYREVGEYLLDDPIVVVGCEWPINVIHWDHVGNVEQQTVARLQTIPGPRYLTVLEQ